MNMNGTELNFSSDGSRLPPRTLNTNCLIDSLSAAMHCVSVFASVQLTVFCAEVGKEARSQTATHVWPVAVATVYSAICLSAMV